MRLWRVRKLVFFIDAQLQFAGANPLEHIARASYPLVLKADALAAGKGVVICADEADARVAIGSFFTEKRFGDTVVVAEEHLEGNELSLLALCDGIRALPMAPAQDYKRILDNDEGPNTVTGARTGQCKNL